MKMKNPGSTVPEKNRVRARLLILHSAFFLLPWLKRRFLPRPFGAGGHLVLASFVFALAFAYLLLDLFFHQIDGGVEIAFAIFGEQVRPADAQAHRAAELPFRDPHVIVLKRDPRVNDARVQTIQFIKLSEHVFLDGIRQRYVMRGEDQLHTDNMPLLFSIFNRQFMISGIMSLTNNDMKITGMCFWGGAVCLVAVRKTVSGAP
jgi:hypothetical protein